MVAILQKLSKTSLQEGSGGSDINNEYVLVSLVYENTIVGWVSHPSFTVLFPLPHREERTLNFLVFFQNTALQKPKVRFFADKGNTAASRQTLLDRSLCFSFWMKNMSSPPWLLLSKLLSSFCFPALLFVFLRSPYLLFPFALPSAVKHTRPLCARASPFICLFINQQGIGEREGDEDVRQQYEEADWETTRKAPQRSLCQAFLSHYFFTCCPLILLVYERWRCQLQPTRGMGRGIWSRDMWLCYDYVWNPSSTLTS